MSTIVYIGLLLRYYYLIMRSKNWYENYATEFLKKVDVQASDKCWNFKGRFKKYGSVTFKGKAISSHKMSYQLFVGPIPDGMFVLHKCDNMRCVNPDHLFLGTGLDNMRDMVMKGRKADTSGNRNGMFGRVGERSPCSKATEDQVIEIRRRYSLGGVTQKELAKEFGLTQISISTIITGKVWKHLPGALPPRPKHGEFCHLTKVSENDIATMRELRAAGMEYRDIGKTYSIDPKTASRLVRGIGRRSHAIR